MIDKGGRASFWGQYQLPVLAIAILSLALLVGCSSPSIEELEAVDYAPLPGEDWQVSKPAEHGLDPMLLAELYLDAAELETLYGLLVVKDGQLIAEDYFNVGSVEQKPLLQSVAKSFTSALVGIALDQGCLSSVDQKNAGAEDLLGVGVCVLGARPASPSSHDH